MNDDEEKLRALPLAKPRAELDARIDRLLATAAVGGAKRQKVGLGYVFAASAFSAAAGAAVAVVAMRDSVPKPIRYDYIERPTLPARTDPFDFSRSSSPNLAVWGSPEEVVVTYPNRLQELVSEQTLDDSNI